MKVELSLNLPSGVIRLTSALKAAGYTRKSGFKRAQLLNTTGGTLYFSRRSDVDNNNGKPVDQGKKSPNLVSGTGLVDVYIHSAAGGVAQFSGDAK